MNVENNLARTPIYKQSRRKRGIPSVTTQHNTGENLKDRVLNVINELVSSDFDETFWKETKKKNEKIVIKLLYDCFERATKNKIHKEDIFHCIAKVNLLFGTHKRTEVVRNYELVSQGVVDKESKRVNSIYHRFKKTISPQ